MYKIQCECWINWEINFGAYYGRCWQFTISKAFTIICHLELRGVALLEKQTDFRYESSPIIIIDTKGKWYKITMGLDPSIKNISEGCTDMCSGNGEQ